MSLLRLVVVAFLVACESSPEAQAAPPSSRAAASEAPAGFWDHWGDGQAELAGYRLTQSRYGQVRQGEAVLVVVTETFTHGQRVKSDGGHSDEYPVIKLNEIRDFQTGIYDYNLMTSSFLRLDGALPRGVPSKVSMSMQEWCGHAFDQLLIEDDGRGMDRTAHSYFDGEGDRTEEHELPDGVLFADALPLLVRGLTGPLPLGEAPLVPRLSQVRMDHTPLSVGSATVSRGPGGTVDSVLGEVQVDHVDVTVGARQLRYVVESAPPHRLLGWSSSDGEEAELTGLIRAPYWQLSGNGLESRRAELGLGVPSFLAPEG